FKVAQKLIDAIDGVIPGVDLDALDAVIGGPLLFLFDVAARDETQLKTEFHAATTSLHWFSRMIRLPQKPAFLGGETMSQAGERPQFVFEPAYVDPSSIPAGAL